MRDHDPTGSLSQLATQSQHHFGYTRGVHSHKAMSEFQVSRAAQCFCLHKHLLYVLDFMWLRQIFTCDGVSCWVDLSLHDASDTDYPLQLK